MLDSSHERLNKEEESIFFIFFFYDKVQSPPLHTTTATRGKRWRTQVA